MIIPQAPAPIVADTADAIATATGILVADSPIVQELRAVDREQALPAFRRTLKDGTKALFERFDRGEPVTELVAARSERLVDQVIAAAVLRFPFIPRRHRRCRRSSATVVPRCYPLVGCRHPDAVAAPRVDNGCADWSPTWWDLFWDISLDLGHTRAYHRSECLDPRY